MRNRWLANLLLLILVVALGALMRRELEQERRVETLTGLLPESVTDILLERPELPAIRLVKEAGGWQMKAPYRVSAENRRIGELVRLADTPVYRSLPRGAEARHLGLGDTSPRLTLNGVDLAFGDIDPVGKHRYVAVDEQIHLIGDGFAHHLIASAEDFVGRVLLPTGFRPAAGTLNGAPLSSEQLADLQGLAAEDIEPLGSELTGSLLSLESEHDAQTLRFLVSDRGRSWARLDLQLRYRLEASPAWLNGDSATKHKADAEEPQPRVPGF
jgi:hypothetical protein